MPIEEISLHKCTSVCEYMNVHMFMYVYMYMCVRVYVCAYTCMFVASAPMHWTTLFFIYNNKMLLVSCKKLFLIAHTCTRCGDWQKPLHEIGVVTIDWSLIYD